MAIWVAELHISARTAHKLSTRHGLQADEVRSAVEQVGGLPYSWHHDSERGPRAIIRTTIRGRPHLVVLYPARDALGDCWHLGSAYAL